MTDAELYRIFDQLRRKQVREAIRNLLAGNDTQCFNEDQYRRMYQKVSGCEDWIWRIVSFDLVKMHLEESRLVEEVRPGVWRANTQSLGDTYWPSHSQDDIGGHSETARQA